MKSPYEQLKMVLGDRSRWEEKQRLWYIMAHDGLRRASKPFRGAADLHFPLVDEAIEKLLPFYFNQAFSVERLAQFTALQSRELAEASESAADYHSWMVTQDAGVEEEGDFQMELLSVIWTMLLRGRGILKIYWNPVRSRLAHEAVDPMYLIVPRCRTLADASLFAHVKHVRVADYVVNDQYLDRSEEFVKHISGGESQANAQAEQDKQSREGFTYSRDEDTIIIWEIYERKKGGWKVTEISPLKSDQPLRAERMVTDQWQGQPFLPFVSFVMEIKDAGWYSPRGVAERLFPFESYLNKTWNEKADAMTFWNRPLYTSNGPIQLPNTANITFAPGEFMPNGLQAVQMPQPPLSFDVEMQQTRQIAAERIHMPDAGVAEPLQSSRRGGHPTATEVDYRNALAQSGVDLKGRLFRLGLGRAYRKQWALLVIHKESELVFFTASDRKVLPEQAAHDQYLVVPDGSADAWNKSQRFQRAMARFTTLRGDPFINQEQLRKDLLMADDARLVKTLFVPGKLAAANEQEDEAFELLLLKEGYPAVANPAENHVLRLGILFGWLQKQAATGQPVDPIAKQRVLEHIGQHLTLLQQANPALAKKFAVAMQTLDPLAGAQSGQGAPMVNGRPVMTGQEEAVVE